MKKTMVNNESSGVYAIYWEKEDNGNGFDTSIAVPKPTDTPESVKLMILDQLLQELQIPISIDEFKLKRTIK